VRCFFVVRFLLTSASCGPSAIAELLVSDVTYGCARLCRPLTALRYVTYFRFFTIHKNVTFNLLWVVVPSSRTLIFDLLNIILLLHFHQLFPNHTVPKASRTLFLLATLFKSDATVSDLLFFGKKDALKYAL